MHAGPITPYIDVAQITLYAFWIFFAGLIYYLRREDKREGYPLDSNRAGVRVQGYPSLPKPKTFILPHGGLVLAPRVEEPSVLAGADGSPFTGAPFVPTGNPMIDGIGPAAYANRADEVERTWGDGLPKIVPLRVARELSVAAEDPDPRGMEVIGADGLTAGVVTDAWADRSENLFRYLEIALTGGTRSVLVPMTFVQFLARRRLKVRSIRADQFADVPALRNPDNITLLEEDKIMGYYGGGQLYALPSRLGPVI